METFLKWDLLTLMMMFRDSSLGRKIHTLRRSCMTLLLWKFNLFIVWGLSSGQGWAPSPRHFLWFRALHSQTLLLITRATGDASRGSTRQVSQLQRSPEQLVSKGSEMGEERQGGEQQCHCSCWLAQGQQHVSQRGLPRRILENALKCILVFAHYQLFNNFHLHS